MKTTSWYRSLLPIVLLSCNALCVTGCVGTIGASEEEVGRDEGLLSALNALLADNVFPIAGSTRQSCSDSYGDPRPNGRTHQGIDCFAPKGTELVAVEDGFIRYARPGGPFSCKEGGDFSGNRISLTGTSGTRYYYGHLENIYVSNGLPVKKGQTIGTVGNTGNALCSVPHLHFEISIPPKYSTIDPFPVMATWGATSGTDQGSPTPSGNDQGSPMPSGNDQGSPMPSGNDQGSPMPSGNDQGSPMPSGNDQGSPMPPIQSVTLHRMYADGDHFYTISQQEVDFALGLGYGLEDYVGVGRVLSCADDGYGATLSALESCNRRPFLYDEFGGTQCRYRP